MARTGATQAAKAGEYGRSAMTRLSALVGERSLFDNDAYRRLWLARVLSGIPVNAVVYTMLILVVNATGKSFFSSLFVVAYIAPTALLGAVSGVLVDRMPKGIVLAGANAVRAGLCVLLALSTDDVVIIYLIAVLFAVGSQFSGPAEGAALPAVVQPEEYVAANSVNNLGSLIAQILGLVLLPAVFLKTVGAPPLALLCAAMFAGAAVIFVSIEGLGGAVSNMHVSIDETRERFAEAWHRLTQDSMAYISVVILVLANTTGLVVATLMPRYAGKVLGVSAENVIFVAAPAAVGIWLAMRIVSNLSGRISPWWTVGGSFAAMLGCVTLLGFVGPLGDGLQSLNPFGIFEPGPFGETSARIIISSVLGPVLAFSFTFVNIVARTIVNERIPREMQGRVLAAQSVLTNLASIPPILLTGFLADVVGVQPVFFVVAVGCGLLALYYAARNLAMPQPVGYR
ncbi:MAG TPA: MFS transporter [Dehalococcoidia bacterium]|nr:MFS transporter [Dehalococcoidia bacterium]